MGTLKRRVGRLKSPHHTRHGMIGSYSLIALPMSNPIVSVTARAAM